LPSSPIGRSRSVDRGYRRFSREVFIPTVVVK
jgi:hypothetical protein